MTTSYAVLVRDRQQLHVHRWAVAAEQPPPTRILLVGVCGTDLQILRNARPDPARVLGHEGLGQAPANGGGTRPVVFNPVDPLHQDAVLGHSYDGLFRALLPSSTPTRTFEVHPDLPADLAVLIEPLAAVLYGWQLLSRAGPVYRLGIWGSGTAAVLNAVVGELAGAAVRLHLDRPARRDYLAGLRVLASCQLRVGPGASGPPDLDAAVLCTPRETAARALTWAVRSVRPGGVVDLFGGFTGGDTHPAVPGVDLGAVRRRNVCGAPAEGHLVSARVDTGSEIALTGHRGTSDGHFRAAQRMLLEHPERFGRVLSDVVSLPAAATLLPRLAAATAAERDEHPHLKVVVDMALSSGRRSPDLTRTVAELAVRR